MKKKSARKILNGREEEPVHNQKRVRNPLGKRVFRELKSDWRRYLLIFLFLTLMIGVVSGCYIANRSMTETLLANRDELNLEDGNFVLEEQAQEALLQAVERGEAADLIVAARKRAKEEVDQRFDAEFSRAFREQMAAGGVPESMMDQLTAGESYQAARNEAYEKALEEAYETADEEAVKAEEKIGLKDGFEEVRVHITPDFYKETEEKGGTLDGTVRIYQVPESMDLPDVLEGKLPENENEIAIDRMHADNVGLHVGDRIHAGEIPFTISGLISLPNYTTLHQKSTDFMFDAMTFDVALVTEGGMSRIPAPFHYAYMWKYDQKPSDETRENDDAENILKALASQAAADGNEIVSFTPAYANPGVNFAYEDMVGDLSMVEVLLWIITMIIAFICAVSVTATIEKESRMIGALRASGYARSELLAHYLAMPMIVTAGAALAGNLLGYTVFKNIVVALYYNSYSLPAYHTVWSSEAFIRTTLIPAAIMFLVNFVILWRDLRKSPVQFMRKERKGGRKKKAMRLPNWKFFARFRTRILIQNLPNYLVMFLGILFTSILLSMAIGMTSSLDYYKANAENLMLAKYQYFLKDTGKAEETPEGAESFKSYSLTYNTPSLKEDVTVYGTEKDSRYISLPDLSGNEIVVSKAFQEKYGVKPGETITLHEAYGTGSHTFTVKDVTDASQTISAFLSKDRMEDVFGEGVIDGYFSDQPLDSLSQDQVATVITPDELTKMADQLNHSMGDYMTYLEWLCVILAAILIYLIIRIILEKNERNIAMVKILGYSNHEISALYIHATTLCVLVETALAAWIGPEVIKLVWKNMLQTFKGWFSFVFPPAGYAQIFLFIFAGYLITVWICFRKIRKVRMDQILKYNE